VEVILGVQYYRPPFPEKMHWAKDFGRIKESGFNTVQLWACWGWIESEPGTYRFDDYDEHIERAAENDLQVVMSTVAEIQPFWIHRLVPDSQMVDHMGHRVISSLRRECNVGLSPGGCTDHPEIRRRMEAFLGALASHYRDHPALVAWDAWNETRWAVQADGHVCYCDYTLAEFRRYLMDRYGSLASLNDAWKRRYASWDDVYPGKFPGRPYTELMEFQRFLTHRAKEHAKLRYQALRSHDGERLIVAHCARPSTWSSGLDYEQALSRGHDWELADVFDGFGSSHFPVWESLSLADVGTRVESIRSAVGEKPMWISELQGGSARDGLVVREPVDASLQQQWIWDGLSRGAKAVIIWCWRDEVFGRESSGFGFAGNDGYAEGREMAMKEAQGHLQQIHRELRDYHPDRGQVGLLFERSSYYLDWAQNGNDSAQAVPSLVGYVDWAQNGNDSAQAVPSLVGYAKGFEHIQIPYEIVDSQHLAHLDPLKLLIMPWPLVVNALASERIITWVERGGTLLVESELASFDDQGFYQDPHSRRLAQELGFESQGRRPLAEGERVLVPVSEESFALTASGWSESLVDLNDNRGGDCQVVAHSVGSGRVLAIGTFVGSPYARDRYQDFESFLRAMVRISNVVNPLACNIADGSLVTIRSGRSGDARMLFALNHQPFDVSLEVDAPSKWFTGSPEIHRLSGQGAMTLKDLGNGRMACSFTMKPNAYTVFWWQKEASAEHEV